MSSRLPVKPLKLDSINRKILATVHRRADISNLELAEEIGLSPAACSQRVIALKAQGFIIGFHAEIDLARVCAHVLAYVEFTLRENTPTARDRFAARIDEIPEFMDCLRLAGAPDFICFTCSSSLERLTEICDALQLEVALGIARLDTRIVVGRTKWYLGYPIANLDWVDDQGA